MGLSRFFRRLNCFGSGQRKVKSRKQMENALRNMHETIGIIEEDLQTTRSIVEECKQRQRAAEEKEEMTRKHQKPSDGSMNAAFVKWHLRRKCKPWKRRQISFGTIYRAVIQGKTPKHGGKKLRRVRSQNDMNKAVPQPPLSPIRDSDEDEFQVWDEFQIWETSRELSCDDVITGTTGNEDYQESVVIMETFL
ncbi:hypothetical protein OS493_007618 [Desmophyllum pertusum]|uniref:Uncharacterized protein n=1 Tax=Desmophyllum pertusum TaxID=174260 RepID=A0A9W9YRQ0_9CNID|nr:hypothetical protein OS493_007618 [Desmophyllum pertusum]